MAVEILVPHLNPAGAAIGLAQLHAEHAALFGGASRPSAAEPTTTQTVTARTGTARTGTAEAVTAEPGWDDELAGLAVASGDPHQVKLVEACRRAYRASHDPTLAGPFLDAARTVTGHDA
jgi:hypothetical protein